MNWRSKIRSNDLPCYQIPRRGASPFQPWARRYWRRCAATLLFTALVAVSCAPNTQFVPMGESASASPIGSRIVEYEIDPAFYATFPECVLVLPPSGGSKYGTLPAVVELALSRQLTTKIPRVIDPTQRDRAARRLGIDLSQPKEIEALAEELDCDTVAVTTLLGAESTYLLTWASIQIGLDSRLVRISDRRVIWRARHVSARSEGGLPLSPLGAIWNSVRSSRFVEDPDVPNSVIEDITRRLVASLPNTLKP